MFVPNVLRAPFGCIGFGLNFSAYPPKKGFVLVASPQDMDFFLNVRVDKAIEAPQKAEQEDGLTLVLNEVTIVWPF